LASAEKLAAVVVRVSKTIHKAVKLSTAPSANKSNGSVSSLGMRSCVRLIELFMAGGGGSVDGATSVRAVVDGRRFFNMVEYFVAWAVLVELGTGRDEATMQPVEMRKPLSSLTAQLEKRAQLLLSRCELALMCHNTFSGDTLAWHELNGKVTISAVARASKPCAAYLACPIASPSPDTRSTLILPTPAYAAGCDRRGGAVEAG
jgi:hypothetical protein